VLPVRVVGGGRDLEAALWLDAMTEPAPLMIHPDQPLADIADLWALAIRAGAALLCRSADSDNKAASAEIAPEDWTMIVNSFVAGHIRTLPEGQSAGPEAVALARTVGVALGPGETWVKPHDRGTPPSAIRWYRWRASFGE
jgi:hypothetical protein